MPLQDEALARRAVAGDSEAFATLYDRHERRVYNLCYRITGSPDDAADATQETFLGVLERLPRLDGRQLNFAAYVTTAARNASYDAIERRKRSTPTDDVPEPAVPVHEVPESVALREAHQEQIRVANQGLPARQREVLALRELQELSYGEVAQIMGMNQNSVAQLISRARINLRDGLRATALGSVASASPQCDRALPLLAMHQDGVLEDPWLAEHLMGCGACRVRLEAMEEAAVAYRQWLLLVPALWLREETAEAAMRASHRGHMLRRRLPLAAGLTAVLLLALAFLAADGAESPTRAFAPAATPEAEAEPVARVVAAPKPVERRAAKKPRVRARKKPAQAEPIVREPAQAAPREVHVAAAPAVTAPEAPAPRRRVRPRRDPRPAPEPPAVVEVADPPAVEQPEAVTEPDPPDPACSTPSCVPPTPPCSTPRACPPPRPVVVVCTSCPLVTPPPPPPKRRPTLVAAPGRR